MPKTFGVADVIIDGQRYNYGQPGELDYGVPKREAQMDEVYGQIAGFAPKFEPSSFEIEVQAGDPKTLTRMSEADEITLQIATRDGRRCILTGSSVDGLKEDTKTGKIKLKIQGNLEWL